MSIDGKGRPTKAQKKESLRVSKLEQAIAAYEREYAPWEKRVDRILKRYRDERNEGQNKHARFNILWANVATLVPATFSRVPKPDVSRRFRDTDPVGRVAGLILERAESFEIEHYPDYKATLKEVVQDRFLGGRGTAWVRYEPHIQAVPKGLPEDGEQVTEDAEEPDEQLDYECAPIDYVHWKDFGHNVARTWEEVTLVWRKVFMTRAACIERFGEDEGSKIPLDSRPDSDKERNSTDNEAARALVIEVWDKATKEAAWFSKSMGKFLDRKSDPLKLEGFFPCPKPLYATTTNETCIPVPDFTLYQDQARELDTLSDRIDGLIKALQVKGVYDGSVPELKRLFTEGSNTDLIAVNNWQAFSEKAGLAGALDLVDLAPIAAALKEAYLAFHEIKAQVDELTGIADVMRGQTDPNETLGAQQMKGNYAGLRLKDYQHQVAEFATEILRLKAQVMCGKFDPQTIMKMAATDQLSAADQAVVPQAMQLLLGERLQDPDSDAPNPLRGFRIEIDADTLVQMDEQAEQAARSQFLESVGGFLQQALPVIQAAPEAGGLVLEMLKFGVTGFKVGKQLEGTIDQAIDQMQQAAKQPKAPPPDPAMEKVKAQAMADQQRLQTDVALERQRMQMEEQHEARRLQAEQQAEAQRAQMEMMLERQRNEMEGARAQQQAMMDAALARFEAMLKAKTAIEVAEIGAQATLDSAQIKGAEAGVQ